MRVAIWSPLPPAPSVVADHTAELLPALAEHHDVVAVVEDPGAVDQAVVPGIAVVAARSAPETDLDIYQIGNSAPHVFAYRGALMRPGVAVLHEWVLHDLVWREAAERNDVSAYLREMRRLHGEAGTFVGRQVCLGRGGTTLPALFAVNDRLLENSLGIVTLTREAGECLQRRRPGTPHLHLPQHFALAGPLPPTRAEARRALGLSDDSPVVTTIGSLTTEQAEVVARAVGRLRAEFPSLQLVMEGEVDPSPPHAPETGEAPVTTGPLKDETLVCHLVAADVLLSLGFPSRGDMPAVLVRALALGRPVLVTAGTPAAEEMPEGAVVPIDPGPREEEELVAFLRRLLGSRQLRDDIGDLAREHALACHGLGLAAARLAGFLGEVHARHAALLRELQAVKADERTLAGYLLEEVHWAARDLGFAPLSLGIEPLLAPLAGRRRVVER